MLIETKHFIEDNIDMIENHRWETLFRHAHDEALSNEGVKELVHILKTCELFDSTQLRNDLLYEFIEERLRFVKSLPNRHSMKDRYIVQFLQAYFTNTFGFSEKDVISFIYQNQANLGITLTPLGRAGQSGIENYTFTFDN